MADPTPPSPAPTPAPAPARGSFVAILGMILIAGLGVTAFFLLRGADGVIESANVMAVLAAVISPLAALGGAYYGVTVAASAAAVAGQAADGAQQQALQVTALVQQNQAFLQSLVPQ